MYGQNKSFMEKLIGKAKLSVIRSWEHKDTTDREWLETNLDSYESESYRIRVLVLEGSPAKGLVLANYGIGEVIAINGCGKYLHKWNIHDILNE